MVKAIPYIFVKNCKKAIELYKNVFGANLLNHMPIPKEMGQQMGFSDDYNYDESTLHAVIEISGAEIMMADNIMGTQPESAGNVEVMLDMDSEKQIEDFYDKAKKSGYIVKMELAKQFWGSTFARLEDPMGIGWQMNFQEVPIEAPKKVPKKAAKK